MSFLLDAASRNAALDAIETVVGTGPTLEIRTGAQPGNVTAGDSGTVLVTITLPSDWLANASAGSKLLSGTWQGSAGATGVAGHFRIKSASGSTVRMEGSVGVGGSGADMILQNTSIASGQQVTITAFTLSLA